MEVIKFISCIVFTFFICKLAFFYSKSKNYDKDR